MMAMECERNNVLSGDSTETDSACDCQSLSDPSLWQELLEIIPDENGGATLEQIHNYMMENIFVESWSGDADDNSQDRGTAASSNQINLINCSSDQDNMVARRDLLPRLRRPSKPVAAGITTTFPVMIGNVMNCNDPELIESFWKNIWGKRARVRVSFTPEGSSPMLDGKVGIQFHGSNVGIAHWCSIAQLYPDRVYRFTDPVVFQRANFKGSIIRVRLSGQVSLVYNITPPELVVKYLEQNNADSTVAWNDPQQSPHLVKRPRKNSSSKNKYPPTKPLESFFATGQMLQVLDISPEKRRFNLEGYSFIFVDENLKIQAFECQATYSPANRG